MTGFEPATPRTMRVRYQAAPHPVVHFLSGWQDSNLRPPAPKAGAMTGLRYTPKNGRQIYYLIFEWKQFFKKTSFTNFSA